MENLLEMSQGNVIWITKMENIRYLTGFTGSTAECIIVDKKITLITDGRYLTQSAQEAKTGVEVVITSKELTYEQAVNNNIKPGKKIYLEGNEVSALSYKKLIDAYDNEFILTDRLIESIRENKTQDELDKIARACEITDQVFSYLLENIKPGMTEIQVKQMIDDKHIEFGADGPSFDAIVASGVNSAKPHAKPSSKVIEEGDILTLDYGCFYQGYCSDMTRTFFVGEAKSEELKKIHDIVYEAHRRQIAACKAGVKLSEIDHIGRNYITEQGYGDKFLHTTGHAIGLEIHEGPRLGEQSTGVLEENMVVTIEPGIYVEGLGGVRIENDLVIKKDSNIILNSSERSYDAYNA